MAIGQEEQARADRRLHQSNPVSPRMKFFISRVFPLPFIIVGALTLYFGVRGLYRANESTTWPVADGTIQNSTVEYESGSEGGGTYHAKIRYQFAVDGQTHSGNDVAYGDYGSSNSSHAQNIADRYPKGKEVKVHYRSGDPDTCLLEPGLHGQAWFLPGVGFIFLVMGSLMAIFLPKMVKNAVYSD